jgi:hypothetical protein
MNICKKGRVRQTFLLGRGLTIAYLRVCDIISGILLHLIQPVSEG